MLIAIMVVLLFLLGFGFMIFSHAHREIHPVNRRIGSFISIFIIVSTTLMVFYLGGYLFYMGLFMGEDPFQIGFAPFNKALIAAEEETEQDEALEKSLVDLNTFLQKQAARQAAEINIQKELNSFKSEIRSLKNIVAQQKKTISRRSTRTVRPRTTSYRYTKKPEATTASQSSSHKVIKDLVGYDPNKYTPENEPILYVPID